MNFSVALHLLSFHFFVVWVPYSRQSSPPLWPLGSPSFQSSNRVRGVPVMGHTHSPSVKTSVPPVQYQPVEIKINISANFASWMFSNYNSPLLVVCKLQTLWTNTGKSWLSDFKSAFCFGKKRQSIYLNGTKYRFLKWKTIRLRKIKRSRRTWRALRDLCSGLTIVDKWGLFNVLHLPWHRTSIFNRLNIRTRDIHICCLEGELHHLF